MTDGLTAPSADRDAPFAKRLAAYLRERFPLLGHGVLIVSYYSANQFLAIALVTPGEPMRYTVRSLTGAVTLLCFFFHLRVFDEHKDYAEDCRFYPGRVLQRGVVTLAELRRLAIAAIVSELVLSTICGRAALAATLVALAFSLLMLKEFFARTWLKRHYFVYAVSHMLVMPLLAVVVFSFTTGRFPWAVPDLFWLYAFVGFLVTFNWEISRKIRAPEQEEAGLDTYSGLLGPHGAARAVLVVRALATVLVVFIGQRLGLGAWFYAALVALFVVCLVGHLRFWTRTNARTAKSLETYAGVYMIAFDLALSVELVRLNGLEFSWW